MTSNKPFFISIPHSGEKLPEFCDWLKALPEEILMCDVDRFVDRLYEPTLQILKIPYIKTEWHRYAADLNRLPEDVDMTSVEGNANPAGMHNRGFHWVITTKKDQLMTKPMTLAMHEKLVNLIYEPFHSDVKNSYSTFEKSGAKEVFHLDCHSMPSVGTSEHRDPGETRAEIVISDCKGKSSKKSFVNLVINSYEKAGFKVAYNWPYFGGKVSEQYGNPSIGHHCVQAELNRALYMDEVTKKYLPEKAAGVQKKLQAAISFIYSSLPIL